MIITLCGNTYAYRYRGTEDLAPHRRAIIGKSLLAAARCGLSLSRRDSSYLYSLKLAALVGDRELFAGASVPTEDQIMQRCAELGCLPELSSQIAGQSAASHQFRWHERPR